MLNRGNIFACALLIFVPLSSNAAVTLSPVECPGKDVNEIRQQADQFEISFLFYHVTWSDDSQAARLVYNHIAEIYRERIYFAAIDCFHLACNCSKTHPLSIGSGSPNRWPTMVIRYGHHISLQYNGEWSCEALQRFINSLFMPVERLHAKEELKQLTMHRDAVVLGIFGDASQLEYRMFVSAGIKWLETDPEYSFRFATAFGAAADDILPRGNNTNQLNPQLLLITSKGIDVAPSAWNVSNIVLWLQTEFVRSLSILYSYNSPKSLTLHLHLSPVLAIIANDYFYEYMYNLTNPEVSVNKISSTNSLRRKLVQAQEVRYVQYTLEKKELLNPLTCLAKEYASYWNFRYYYALNNYLKKIVCGLGRNCYGQDLASVANAHELCLSKTQNGSPTSKIAAAKYLKKFVENNWHEFKSEQNQSLSVVILDNARHLDFLHTQGIPHADVNSVVTLMIADRLKESVFVTQDMFTYDALRQFVRNYYSKNLVAHKRNSPFNTKHTLSRTKIFLEHVNNEMLLKIIELSNLTTIALFYSPQCVFSTLASQALIQLSATLDDSSGIQIIRINTQYNDLPWEFKIPSTPTLIVFPRGRASDSRVFPNRLKFNVRNVFSFVLAQMETVDQLKALLSCCRRRKLHSLHMRKCYQYVRALATKHISRNMKLRKIAENHHIKKQMEEWNVVNLELKAIFPLY
ncbi:uncharacterized protein LOC128861470 [Anastrepha ludens]|uniref:uncharacterized protein LOC128861470 n=1 Tax=Anastrepha ludens TaxID=28586 RepID=UPI0023B05958|nr:uncharacterized protein LOC128861470 [Anastrepha ludens]